MRFTDNCVAMHTRKLNSRDNLNFSVVSEKSVVRFKKLKGKIHKSFIDRDHLFLHKVNNLADNRNFANIEVPHKDPMSTREVFSLSYLLRPFKKVVNWWVSIKILYFVLGQFFESLNCMRY
jgi:hypothetical protein